MNEYYYARSDRVAKEKEYWTKLKQLADENNVLGFYKLYSEYLEWNSIISPSRKAIYRMAKAIVELIEKNNEKIFNI